MSSAMQAALPVRLQQPNSLWQEIQSVIPVDEVIEAMREVGDAMPCGLKETALGGLAATPTGILV